MIDWITSVLLVVGTLFTVTASLGMLRMPDFYTRLHGPTKAATLGAICVLLGATVYFTFGQGHFSVRELLAIGFLFLTAPVSSHMLCKAGRVSGVKFHKDTRIES